MYRWFMNLEKEFKHPQSYNKSIDNEIWLLFLGSVHRRGVSTQI